MKHCCQTIFKQQNYTEKAKSQSKLKSKQFSTVVSKEDLDQDSDPRHP